MKDIKARAEVVVLMFFALGFFYFLITFITDTGTQAVTEGGSGYWGFEWVADRLGWIFLIAVALFFMGYLIIKRRR